MGAVEAELEEARKEVQRLQKGEKKGENEQARDLARERAKREKLESEVKELKVRTRSSALYDTRQVC